MEVITIWSRAVPPHMSCANSVLRKLELRCLVWLYYLNGAVLFGMVVLP